VNISIARITLTAATLLMVTSMAFAVEVATPDFKGAAKASADSAKAVAEKTKADAKADADKTKTGIKGAADKTKTDAKGAADKAKADAKAKIVDINSASEADLKAIPGIGDAYSAKIIAGRPYANKTQLKSRKILPGPIYEKTKDLVIAKQPKK
jgi:DNA uptake protein ComE-like DNA-binding protein